MTIGLSGVVREAVARWRRDRELLTIITGVFLFVPLFAWFLLVPEPIRPAGATDEQLTALVFTWLGANLQWLALRIGFELFATAAVMRLYLARDHATVGELLQRSLATFPGFAIAVLASWGAIGIGICLVVVPGLYLYGRTALTAPVAVAEREAGIIGALTRSLTLTKGHGWRLAALLALPLLSGIMALRVIGGVEELAGGNPVAAAICAALAAAAVTAATLAGMLLRVALYRRLAAPRHGI